MARLDHQKPADGTYTTDHMVITLLIDA